ncbi:B12-binding domain-containing radical SAM protein [Desulfolithobacter sp.]
MKITLLVTSLKEDELHKRQLPLGIGYLASYVEKHLPDVTVEITADVNDVFLQKPDMVGISSVSQCFNEALEHARKIKKHLAIPVLLGGYHVTSLPQQLPSCFDAGVIGEGETTFLHLVRLLQDEGALSPSSLRHIPGICYHDRSGAVKITEPVEPLSSIDLLPYPKRNISPGAKNIFQFSSRGCIYRCKFCASSRHWRRFRPHSAAYFVQELKYLQKTYEATSIHLLDDLFFADPKRVREIVTMMRAEGLAGQFRFDSFISSNLASRDILLMAREMGFTSIKFGGETGSDRLLKEIKGPHASVAHHQRCINLCRELGLDVRASFIFGSPGETEEDLELTYQFLKRNKGVLKIHGFYLTMPIPGTPYWDLAMQKGLVSEEMDWSRLNIDYLKEKSFDLEQAIYLNEDNVSRATLRHYFETFRKEFEFFQG